MQRSQLNKLAFLRPQFVKYSLVSI